MPSSETCGVIGHSVTMLCRIKNDANSPQKRKKKAGEDEEKSRKKDKTSSKKSK